MQNQVRLYNTKIHSQKVTVPPTGKALILYLILSHDFKQFLSFILRKPLLMKQKSHARWMESFGLQKLFKV